MDGMSNINRIPNQTRSWLSPMILVVAIKEDIVGPLCAKLDPAKYVPGSIPEFTQLIEAAIAAGKAKVPVAEIDGLARLSAAEMLEVRRVNESVQQGKAPIEAVREMDLYEWYHEYFEWTPRMDAMALHITLIFSKQLPRRDNTNN